MVRFRANPSKALWLSDPYPFIEQVAIAYHEAYMKPAMQYDPQLFRQRQHAWYGLNLGRTLLETEVTRLNGILSNLFGYHLLQVGQIGDADLLAGSRITHRMVLGVDVETRGRKCLYARADALPLASDTIDVIVLPHTLEFETEPHQVLREAERVLIPEGHVVILGFNPWSLWGLWRLFLRRGSYPPWCGNFRGLTRIKDWLALLGFDTIEEQGYFFRPPLQNLRVMQKLSFMENVGARWWPGLAGCYVLLAKKRVATLTPIKPSWRRSRLVNAGVVEPTASHMKHD